MEEITWRRRRLFEMSNSSWNWCVDNNLVKYSKEKDSVVVDHKTILMVSDGWNLAECIFNGTERKRRLQCKRFVKNVVNPVQLK